MKLALYLFSFAIAMGCYTLQAQDLSKYKNMDGVNSVSINKNLFKLMSQFDMETEDPEAQQMLNIIDQLKGIQIFTTSKSQASAALNKDAIAYMNSQQLEELMDINDESGKKVKFYFRPGDTDQVVKLLFMHIHDQDETTVILIEGNVNLAEIGKIAKEFNLPGSDSFNELEKTN